MKERDIKTMVRKEYAKAARRSCCSPQSEAEKSKEVTCCQGVSLDELSKKMGYTDEELAKIPEGSNLGLGCGNPVALASVQEGEVVLDLGAGAGVDCFLVAHRVGKSGKVIGVDMTPEMVDRARENAENGGYENVEFRLGEIENLPAGDGSADVVISNCVINLSPDKERVFQESFRVLKPGGRIIVSDIVLLEELPDFIRTSASAYVGCISGALLKNDYVQSIEKAGFAHVRIEKETHFPVEFVVSDPTGQPSAENPALSEEDMEKLVKSAASIIVQGEKPA